VDEPLAASGTEPEGGESRGHFYAAASSIVVGTNLPARTIGAIRQMTRARQVATVGLMLASNNFVDDFACAFLPTIPRAQKVCAWEQKKLQG
jgi:hypothetical protein